jgi:hypothetical protein
MDANQVIEHLRKQKKKKLSMIFDKEVFSDM